MRILAIAYACEPERGSEPGVGWNWVKLIAKSEGTSISVITRKNNKPVIEKYYENHKRDDINFLYYDLPPCILRYKKRDKKPCKTRQVRALRLVSGNVFLCFSLSTSSNV